MVSAKALAAIGVTMIVVIPVLMGYVLAIDEEERESWQTTSETRISDLLLNNTTPYYGSYKGTSNNSALFDGAAIVAPDYITTTATYSSLPIYTATYESYNTDTVTSTTTAVSSATIDASYVGVHMNNVQFGGPGQVVYTDQGYVNEANWPIVSPRVSVTLDVVKTSATTWHVEFTRSGHATQVFDNVTSWYFQDFAAGSGVTYDRMVTIPYDGAYSAYLPEATLQVNDDWYYGAINLSVIGNQVTVNGETTTYDSEPTVKIRSPVDFSIQKSVLSGTYADPADGWTLPAANTTYAWLNNQVNNSATIYAYIPSGETLTINGGFTITNTSGTVTATYGADSLTVGDYPRLQIVVAADRYFIGGIVGWPSMGTNANVYNTVEFARTVSDFRTIDLEVSATSIHLRVDNANVIAGVFPSTLDLTIDLGGIFPDASLDIYFNSIGVYGEYITFAGHQYPVNGTNGSIIIDGQSVRLLKAHFSAWWTDDHYSIRINGIEIEQTQTLPSITFGGEWVITAIAYKMEIVQDTTLAWHPGQFVLDKQSFGAIAMLVCLAMLVILGMSGGRSMSKMGILLLVCGGAALVIFLFV